MAKGGVVSVLVTTGTAFTGTLTVKSATYRSGGLAVGTTVVYMRRSASIAILVLVLGLGAAATSEAAFYVGGGNGIRVAFLVKGHKLIQADVVARLYCVGPHGNRHFNRIQQEYAFPDSPLRLGRREGFRWDTRGERQEEGFTVEHFLAGRVGHDSIKGRYEYSAA
jgi:hypothetical protein